jgi:hypothetical protein
LGFGVALPIGWKEDAPIFLLWIFFLFLFLMGISASVERPKRSQCSYRSSWRNETERYSKVDTAKRIFVFLFFILYFQICSFKKTFRNREGKVERKSMRTLFCANNLVGKGFFFILKSDPLHFCFFKFFHLRTTVMRKELRQKNWKRRRRVLAYLSLNIEEPRTPLTHAHMDVECVCVCVCVWL